jgi:hypothetical protein
MVREMDRRQDAPIAVAIAHEATVLSLCRLSHRGWKSRSGGRVGMFQLRAPADHEHSRRNHKEDSDFPPGHLSDSRSPFYSSNIQACKASRLMLFFASPSIP